MIEREKKKDVEYYLIVDILQKIEWVKNET